MKKRIIFATGNENKMKEIRMILKDLGMEILSMKEAGVAPIEAPVRGGTDGCTLSFMGMPCPNLFTGGMNAHSVFEFIPVPAMEKAVEVLLNLVKIYSSPIGK